MPLGTELVGLGRGNIVLDGDPAPPKRGIAHTFQPMSVVVHMAGWIKMPLSAKVGLGPGDIVLDG